MTSEETKRERAIFLKKLYRQTEGKLSAFDMNNIVDAVQHYIPCDISIKVAKDVTEFSKSCSVSTEFDYDYVDDIAIPSTTRSSHLLASSKEMAILDFTPTYEDALLLLGTIRFPTDKVNFVLIKHEIYKNIEKTSELSYELTILIPKLREAK